MTILALFLVGIVVGAINAVAGGGMLIGFPILIAFGLPPIVANATGKLAVLPGQLASVIGYHSFLRGIPRKYYVLIVPAAIGSLIGVSLLAEGTNAQFGALVPYLILGAVILFTAQPLLKRFLAYETHGAVGLTLPILSLILLSISVYAGYFGAGFGFILLSLLGFASLRNIHYMNALKNVIGTFSVMVTLIFLLQGTLIDLPTGLTMAAGNGVGGYFAARLAPRIPTTILRAFIICFGLVTAGYFFIYQ